MAGWTEEQKAAAVAFMAERTEQVEAAYRATIAQDVPEGQHGWNCPLPVCPDSADLAMGIGCASYNTR